jgi:hypothetical protein
MGLGLGVRAAPFTYAAHALAVAAAAMVLVWAIYFRGGLAIEATNKNLIFNVGTTASPLPALVASTPTTCFGDACFPFCLLSFPFDVAST